MSIDSLKRVLMATKEKARGMRKDKLENRLNPKSAAPALAIEIEAPAESPEGEESMDSSLALKKDDGLMKDASPFAKGPGAGNDVEMEPGMEGEPEMAEGPPSEEEKSAALEEIRALLARV